MDHQYSMRASTANRSTRYVRRKTRLASGRLTSGAQPQDTAQMSLEQLELFAFIEPAADVCRRLSTRLVDDVELGQ